MKNNCLLLIVLSVFLIHSFNLRAQGYDGRLLKNYFLPDITRRSLDFTLNSGGLYNKVDIREYSMDNKSYNFNGEFQTTFNSYKNTRKFIGTHHASFNFAGKIDRPSKEEKKSSFHPSFIYTNSSRFYISKLFFETGGTAYFSNDKDNYDSKENSRYSTAGISIPLLLGIGRIEDVTDMRQAIYVVSSLSKQGILSQHIDDNKMMEFAQVISTVKNKRFLDYRKHLKREIATVDSFLVDNGYITNATSDYFTTLYDYWFYGALFERKRGIEFKGGVQPGGSYSTHKRDEKTNIPSMYLDALLGLEYENPVNLYWQNSASVDLTGRVGKSKRKYENMDDIELRQKAWDIEGKYSWGYYPNSRTHLNLGVSESFAWERHKYVNSDPSYFRIATTSFHLKTYYYISPQLRLEVSGRMFHNYLPSFQLRSSWYGEYIATLTYSLF